MENAPAVQERYLYTAETETLLTRVKKIQGQARGIEKMITDGRYCLDIVQQLTALSAAADELSLKLLETHIEGCVAGAIRADQASGEAHIKELMKSIRKALKR
ncbi:MAG: metal-sensitive transcriptional regulator [Dehalogenimonas sp.]|jgi:DNA-binding FrmR family transcriptional regulator|uniref:Metal-sensitive transcriptional regulator n=1 Tax=Candidatus Dehalogenimonas loeffleri TaxID=3127115 RepID=A0ABZ2J4E7_9CHLR|nr:metal-sensitive transcriptional regulator [Dehalogenimonas sp.]